MEEGSDFYMDVSGYRYDFTCLPKPKEDPTPEPEDKDEDPEEKEEKEKLPAIKTKEDLIEYLTPTARQLYSSAAFAPYLDWMIDTMIWCSYFGTIAWPVWISLGGVIELYNFIMVWTGFFKMLTIDEYTFGYQNVTFMNWIKFPVRIAIVNSMAYWLGVILTILPLTGYIPTWVI